MYLGSDEFAPLRFKRNPWGGTGWCDLETGRWESVGLGVAIGMQLKGAPVVGGLDGFKGSVHGTVETLERTSFQNQSCRSANAQTCRMGGLQWHRSRHWLLTDNQSAIL